MSHLDKTRWADRAFLLLLTLLLGIWFLFPPQRIDPAQAVKGPDMLEVIRQAKRGATP